MVKIIDCPRDAIQGINTFIPTWEKIEYLNQLLRVGFHAIDFGSFVSPRAIPQLRDTSEVVENLDLSNTRTELLAIVANERGAIEACMHDSVKNIGFPFSISETFLYKNTHSTLKDAFDLIKRIRNCTEDKGKKLVVFLSMAFGNPYEDKFNYSIVNKWVRRLSEAGIDIIVLSDTVGIGKTEDIKNIFNFVISDYPNIEFGAHLHARADDWKQRVEAAYNGGCRRFDGALKGLGGCPMSGVEMIGNISTENIIFFMESMGEETGINKDALNEIMEKTGSFYHV
jgi:hydroxymethylglutaryl-CoA lyase